MAQEEFFLCNKDDEFLSVNLALFPPIFSCVDPGSGSTTLIVTDLGCACPVFLMEAGLFPLSEYMPFQKILLALRYVGLQQKRNMHILSLVILLIRVE